MRCNVCGVCVYAIRSIFLFTCCFRCHSLSSLPPIASVGGKQSEHAEDEEPWVGQERPLLLHGYVLRFQAHHDKPRSHPRAPKDAEDRENRKSDRPSHDQVEESQENLGHEAVAQNAAASVHPDVASWPDQQVHQPRHSEGGDDGPPYDEPEQDFAGLEGRAGGVRARGEGGSGAAPRSLLEGGRKKRLEPTSM